MRRILPILFLFVMACVDPLDVKLTSVERRLVVDGLITNRPGPYQVKLYYSNQLSTTKLRPFDPVTLPRYPLLMIRITSLIWLRSRPEFMKRTQRN